MKPLIKHFGKIVNGKKEYNNPSLYAMQIAQLEGQEFEETIKKRSKKPSLDQYAYYWGIILPICYTHEMFSHYAKSDDIHEDYFGDMFLSYTKVITLPSGEKRQKQATRSLSDLNAEEISLFIEKVRLECGFLGITILTPEEYKNQYYK